MRKKKAFLSVLAIAICLASFVMLCGCETAKGAWRDIKDADQWFRDHAW
ncbi:MAG: hypothetical protein V1840_03615 [Candidatus Omnitrophota bacterium]